jgi:hypothetical protein
MTGAIMTELGRHAFRRHRFPRIAAIAVLLSAACAGAMAAPNIPPSELPGRERQRFQDSPIDRFTQPGQKPRPLWQWDCDPAKIKSRKHTRSNSKRC